MTRDVLAVQPIIQVGASDCAVAAMAMYLNMPYRRVSEAAMAITPKVHLRGLYETEMRATAKRLGVTLTAHRAPVPDISERTGILCVKTRRVQHAAVLFEGVIVDPKDGQLWNLETWVATKCWHVTALLT